MRFSVLTALLLATCALLCAKNSAPLIQNIGVFINFEDRPSDSTVQAMEREVGAIMRPASLGFTWRDMGMSQDPTSGIFADLMVIKFKGSCSGAFAPMSELGPALSDDLSLAETSTSHGQVLHFTEVHCDEVRRYLANDVSGLSDADRAKVFGKALGRIISHEMYHVFANTEKHATGGVARAYHSRRELVQPVFSFDKRETRVLHDYAARAMLSQEPNHQPLNPARP
jgi:hypothetical protein